MVKLFQDIYIAEPKGLDSIRQKAPYQLWTQKSLVVNDLPKCADYLILLVHVINMLQINLTIHTLVSKHVVTYINVILYVFAWMLVTSIYGVCIFLWAFLYTVNISRSWTMEKEKRKFVQTLWKLKGRLSFLKYISISISLVVKWHMCYSQTIYPWYSPPFNGPLRIYAHWNNSWDLKKRYIN